MLLLHCKCGSVFTIPDVSLKNLTEKKLYCPNCDRRVGETRRSTSIGDLERVLADAEIEIHVLPDNAKLKFTFDA